MYYFRFALLAAFLAFGSFSHALVKHLPSDQWEQELQTLDNAINKLTDLRNREIAKAERAQNRADALQFQSNNLMDARRKWQEAENSREIAARYQQEIDQLQVRKDALLEKHAHPKSKEQSVPPENKE